jgi:type II secretory pathway pseudopilin PulG
MNNSRRCAFTLIELLVVCGIFAALFGLILVGSRADPANQVRQAAQAFSSALVRSQSRSLLSGQGAGVILEAISDLGLLTVDSNPRPALVGTANIVVSSSTSAFVGNASILNADLADLADGYRIQFRQADNGGIARPSPFFRLLSGSSITFRADAGQTAHNTIWPDQSDNPFAILVPRYPSRGLNATSLPKQSAVDLRFSGLGDDPYQAPFGSLRNASEVAICFNKAGRVDSFVRNVYSQSASRSEVEPNSEIYFLVALQDAITNRQALASDASYWVVIKPSSGRVTVAGNVAQMIDETFLDSGTQSSRQQMRTALWNARAKARAGANLR